VLAPDKILDKHLGILGINGSGKTYTAKGLAERLLDDKQRICVIDPTGVWYGLKSSASGKSAGYAVVIFGGAHADVQIGGLHGEAIAEAIGTSTTPAILDVSQMRGSERTRFFADFAETLRIKNTGPLNLFIDEAHLFMPQGRVSDPQSANMLHAANNLISLGRSRGLRITIISQRPAKIHKDSLTQVHSLIAMRLIAPQDRAAVEAWIADQADVQRGKEIIASLPALKTGEGWLWAPEIDVLERIKFPKITTFDSSRSPDGEGAAEIVLAPINLDAIQGKLASIKHEKVANDPTALKRQVVELQRQLADKPRAQPMTDNKGAVQKAYAEGFKAGIDSYGMAWQSTIATMAAKIHREIGGWPSPKPGKMMPKHDTPPPSMASALSKPKVDRPIASAATDGFSGPERLVISSLNFWKSIGHDTPIREQVSAVAGYTVSGSSFIKAVSNLRVRGLIDVPVPGALKLQPSAPHETIGMEDAKNRLISIMDGPRNLVLGAFKNGNDFLSRDEVASAAGYTASGSSFIKAVSGLAVLNILEKPSPGMLKLSDWAAELLA
jgi:uncharacterized protein